MPTPHFLKHFDQANLRLRLVSSAIIAPLTLFVVYLGGLAYGALVTCVVTIGLYEWLRLIVPKARELLVGIACAMLIVVMMMGSLFSAKLGFVLSVLLTLALFFVAWRQGDRNAIWIALGIPYLGGSGLALLALRAMPGCGAGLIVYLLMTVWGTDIGAFAAGRLIGGPKLVPSISPSKTWAGLGGGIALAATLGYLTGLMLGARSPGAALILSPVVACVAQVGDVFESYFKRRAGVKESGDLIPGHGGVLDRIDGLVFAALFVFIFQALIGGTIQWW